MLEEKHNRYVEFDGEPEEITSEQFDEMVEALAVQRLDSIPLSERSYFYYRNDDEIKEAFKRSSALFLREIYVVIPSAPPHEKGPAPS